MEIILANPRGFCAGVDRAIEIVERALVLFGPPVYVRHEVVHNQHVVNSLRTKGAIFVNQINEIPDHSITIFSAHGVSQQVKAQAKQRHLKVFDATCPLVTKVHMEVARHAKAGHEVVLIGHAHHPEVEGTLGQYDCSDGGIYLIDSVEKANQLVVKQPQNLHFVTQTTLSIDDTQAIIATLRQRFTHIQGPKKDDICYATQNRQNAVKALAKRCDLFLVVGSKNSSNSNRLREIAAKHAIPAYLIDGADELQKNWLTGKTTVGVTAGASAPEVIVQAVVRQLQDFGYRPPKEATGVVEKVEFNIPADLRA